MATGDPRAALAALIGEHGESYAALSRLLGRNPAYLQQFVARGSPRLLAERDRQALARYFGVAEAVLGGPATEPLVALPALDVTATAGDGGLLADEARRHERRFEPAFLRAIGVRPAAASLIRVQGDSMAPTLFDGDEILVDADVRTVTRAGGLYVLRLDGAVMVKRLRREGRDILITSDNPRFTPLEPQPADTVTVIGRVAWLGRVPT